MRNVVSDRRKTGYNMAEKISEKKDSALMSGNESDIIDNREKEEGTKEVADMETSVDYSPMSYTLNQEFDRIPHKKVPTSARKLVAICASTGGPEALSKIIPKIPENLNAPIVIVQHMSKGFTASFARRLDEKSYIKVEEVKDGEELQKGVAYIAKGGEHLRLVQRRKRFFVSLYSGPARSGLKPCADVLFESINDLEVDEVICVVLTGMGSDGTVGIGRLSEKKNIYCIAQDNETSTAVGMPEMIRKAGIADEVLPLDRIAEAIIRVTGIRTP